MNTKNINMRSMAITLASALVLLGSMPLMAMADNPMPTTTSISPSIVTVGSPASSVSVYGTNFVPGSLVNVNGSAKSTSYVSPTQLTATVTSADLANVGTLAITVTNPSPGGGTSNAQTFTVGNMVPTLSSMSPSSVASGGNAFTLTVNGTNFLPGSLIHFNGSARSTAYVSSTQLTATINAADIANSGAFNVTVTNPSPGGGTSNAKVFVATGSYLVPVLTSISPASVTAGNGSFTITVYGSNFSPGATVRFNGLPKTTTFVSASQLTATIPASDVSVTGTQAISVTNSDAGGVTSNAVLFTISPTSVIPGLPNTGFGPSDQAVGLNTGLIAIGVALAGIFLTAIIIRKRAWATK